MPSDIQSEVTVDPIAGALERYAQNILVVVFGLLPVLFLPMQSAPFDYTKIFLVLIGLIAALVLGSLSVLRTGKIVAKFPRALISLWVVAIVGLVSALLSGDARDALIGDQFNIHSVAFVALLALTASVWGVFGIDKNAIMRLYVVLAASTGVLVIFHLLRLVFGVNVLSFGIFTSLIATPVGSWNDLALFLGLSVLLSLVALEQLPLTKAGKIIFGVVAVLSLFMLAVINFFTVWLVLGAISLVMIVYTIGKGRFNDAQMSFVSQRPFGSSSLPLALVVFAASVTFIIGGASIGASLSKYTGVSYIEVRPSFQATTDIARQVYKDHALLGIGMNKFVDSWRLYKDPIINTTVFWNTEFSAGNGYITTFFVTAGVLGGLAWLTFLVLFTISGVRFLMTAPDSDRMWYFIGVSSFVSALYLWGMSVVYVPGAVMLILAALCTGITVAARHELDPKHAITFSIIHNRRAGFLVTIAVIAVVVGSVSVLYTVSRHYGAVYTFNRASAAIQGGASLDSVAADLERAYTLSKNDAFARKVVEYQLGRMSQLLAVPEPTAEQKKEFETLLVNAVNAGSQAVQADSTEPAGWSVLGAVYNLLVTTNKESVYDRGKEALTKARELDPKNPAASLSLAVFEARSGNVDAAKILVEESIQLKPNYIDAFFFLSQLEIASGDIDAAIQSSQAMISLEPQNPARHYQLGVLESAKNSHPEAAAAFERAIELDTNFANARYLLAQSYDALKRPEEAKAQLKKVLELNPGNENVLFLLDTLEKNGSLSSVTAPQGQTPAVSEQSPVSEDNGAVITNEDPNSSLVKPVNTVPVPTEAGSATQDTPAVEAPAE